MKKRKKKDVLTLFESSLMASHRVNGNSEHIIKKQVYRPLVEALRFSQSVKIKLYNMREEE